MYDFLLGNAAWGFREADLEAQLAITRDMGLTVHELGIANAPKDLPADADDNTVQKVKKLFADYGISLDYAATGDDFSMGNKDDVSKIKKVTALCARLGIRYLRIFAGFSKAEEVTGARWDTMIEALNECAAYAKEKRVTLVIETHGGVNGFENGEVEHFHSVTTDKACLRRLLAEIDDSILFNYDPANMYAVGYENPGEIYEIIKDRTAYVHLKDFRTMPSGHIKPAACGESEMDWARILQDLKDFRGAMLFEYEIPEALKEGLMQSYQYIKEMKDLCQK